VALRSVRWVFNQTIAVTRKLHKSLCGFRAPLVRTKKNMVLNLVLASISISFTFKFRTIRGVLP
jgi:hypothetical protein